MDTHYIKLSALRSCLIMQWRYNSQHRWAAMSINRKSVNDWLASIPLETKMMRRIAKDQANERRARPRPQPTKPST